MNGLRNSSGLVYNHLAYSAMILSPAKLGEFGNAWSAVAPIISEARGGEVRRMSVEGILELAKG